MEKKQVFTKEILVIMIMIVMLIVTSVFSFSSIRQLQGTARVVNYVGIVRGATQRLVKNELYGQPNDALKTRLDGIVSELIRGNGSNDLVVLNDREYINNMYRVEASWTLVKDEITNVRNGADPDKLYELSESYFELVDETVSLAELYSERQVLNSIRLLMIVNGVIIVFLILGLIYYFRSTRIKEQVDILDKVAFLDPLSQLSNRAGCERKISELTANPPPGSVAVIIFDINNLRQVNERLGHEHGDRIIADFAKIIKSEALNKGFLCRYGGDEFLGIFEDYDTYAAEQYLKRVDEKIIAYNLMQTNSLEQISVSTGYVIDRLSHARINDMINEADKHMYIKKRQEQK